MYKYICVHRYAIQHKYVLFNLGINMVVIIRKQVKALLCFVVSIVGKIAVPWTAYNFNIIFLPETPPPLIKVKANPV